MRAEALFYCEEFENAIRLLKQALRMDPDNAAAKAAFRRAKSMQQEMANAKQLNSDRDFAALQTVFTELLDGVRSQLIFDMVCVCVCCVCCVCCVWMVRICNSIIFSYIIMVLLNLLLYYVSAGAVVDGAVRLADGGPGQRALPAGAAR